MWKQTKQITPLLSSKLRQIEGRFRSVVVVLPQQQLVRYTIPVYPKLASLSGNVRSAMSFSSNHPHSHEVSSAASVKTPKEGIVERTIREKLLATLAPVTHLTIMNESHRHNVPVNSETHFKVLIVTPMFDTVPTLVGRHRLVNTILADELSQSGPIHALSIIAKTPAQWYQQQQQNSATTIEPSPPCLGGDGTLPPKNAKET